MPSRTRASAAFLEKISPIWTILHDLPGREKRSIYVRSIMIVVGNFLDLIGVFLFGIIGSILLDARNPVLSNLSSQIPDLSRLGIGSESKSSATIILITIVLLFFVLKTAFGMLGSKLLFDDLSRIATTQSVMTLARVRKYPMSKFNSISVSDLQYLATQSTQSAIYDCLGYSILVVVEVALLASLSIFYVLATGAVGLVTVIYFVFCIKLAQKYISSKMKAAEKQRIKSHLETLEMIRGQASIATYLRGESVFRWFKSKITPLRSSEFESISKLQYLANLPKFSLEILLILGIFLIAFVQWLINPANLSISLGIFFVTSLRFMPSLARLQAYYNQVLRGMQGSSLYITVLGEASNNLRGPSLFGEQINSSSLLECKELQIIIGGKQLLSAEKIVFPRRGLVAIVGESGSGKSTLLNYLSGYDELNAESKGCISWGVDESEKILVSQFTSLLPLPLLENIFLDLEQTDSMNRNFVELAGRLGLSPLISQTLGRTYNLDHLQLSGGELQRIGILRAFLRPGSAYFLDEPTASLDKLNRSQVWELLKDRSRNTLIVVTTHDSDVSEFADSIYRLEDCKLSVSDYA